MSTTSPYFSYHTITQLGLQQRALQSASAINKLLIIDKDNPSLEVIYNGKIVLVKGPIGDIAAFMQPVYFNGRIYLDCRTLFNDISGEIRNLPEWNFTLMRGKIEYCWQQDKSSFYPIENFVVDAFSTWVGNGIQRNMNYQLKELIMVKVIAAIYYLSLFADEKFYHKDDLLAFLIKKVPIILGIPQEIVLDLIDAYSELIIGLATHQLYDKPNGLINNLTIALNTIFSEHIKLTPNVFFDAVCPGAIISANSTITAAIACEYPPALIAMLISASDRNFQNKTNLGRAVLMINRRYDGKVFSNLMKGIKDESTT